jgi:hypothetical protein
VASDETNSRSCETKTSVPLNFSSAVLSDSIDSMSRWLVGSSMTSTFGFISISLPKIMRPCSPPEITLTALRTSLPENSRRPRVPRISVARSSPSLALRARSRRSSRSGWYRCEILGVVLCIVTGACLLRPLDAAALGLQFAHQQLQQGRLADTVFADDRQAIATVE